MNKIYQESHSDGKNAGFTLIELLVVVLIIGILAAIAVPKYESAVLKSKIARDLPLLISVLDAQDRYQLANGKYSLHFDELDISVPCTEIKSKEDGDYCSLAGGGTLKIYNRVGGYLQRKEYMLNFQKGVADNTVRCGPAKENAIAKKVCKSYGGNTYPNTTDSLVDDTWYSVLQR